MSQTYAKYLKLDSILNSQNPLSPNEHDEMLFITIHQTYEIWFKQILHETSFLVTSLEKNELSDVQATLKRVRTILKTLVKQVDILETMTPLSFSSFRSRLEQASGFQSFQFRQIESVLGMKDANKLKNSANPETSQEEISKILNQSTIFDCFLKCLNDYYNFPIPEDIMNRDKSEAYTGDPRVEEVINLIYRNNPTLRNICENFVDWDEGIQEWRYRHIKMVERTIGMKMGTGGSSGVQYLLSTLSHKAFPDLWNVRRYF